MKAPSTALLQIFSPLRTSHSRIPISPYCRQQIQDGSQLHRSFSSTPSNQKRNKGSKPDMRITQLRYHLQHPLTPRPLRWSRTRGLRHWTIHRAWQLYQAKLRRQRQSELQKQYASMYNACEALRLMDSEGMTAEDRSKVGEAPNQGKDVGRLFRVAMLKHGVWDGVPIEYARIQTDSPPRKGWNSQWTR